MRIIILILFFSSWTNSIFAQTVDSVNQRKWIVKLAPANLIDPINPSIQLGIERRINVNNSVQVELGYILPSDILYHDSNDSTVFPNYSGLKARIEYRRDLSACGEINNMIKSTFCDTKGAYLATELMYTYNRYDRMLGYNYPTNTLGIIPDYCEKVKVDRQVIGLNLKLGLQQNLGRFVFECYMGIGIKYKMVKHLGRSNYNDKWTSGRHPNIYSGADLPGNYWTASIPFNVKIGYMF